MMRDLDREGQEPEPYTLALERMQAALEPVGKERIAIEDAGGRIAARDLVAPFQIPSCPVATRSGFAVRAAESERPGLHRLHELRLRDAENPGSRALGPGEAVAVSAGEPLPEGANAVLPGDRATLRGDRLLVATAIQRGFGVLFPGDDLRDGTPVVVQGRPLTPPQLGLLSATGLSHIEVIKIPRVGLISIEPNTRSGASNGSSGNGASGLGASNAVVLGAWCSRFGLSVSRWAVSDDSTAIAETVDAAAASCDALVTSGSLELVDETLDEMDRELVITNINLRPGHRTRFGHVAGVPVFQLPASPVANETAFLLLALPGLLTLAGTTDPPFAAVPARLTRDLRRSRRQKRWTQVVRVQLSPGTFFLQAVPLAGRAIRERQGRLASLAAADGIVLLDEGEIGPRAGDIVGVILLGNSWV